MQNLFGTIIAMFEIEISDADNSEAREDDAYVQQGSLRIPAVAIVNHIENQGSFACDYYKHLKVADQQNVINHIATCEELLHTFTTKICTHNKNLVGSGTTM